MAVSKQTRRASTKAATDGGAHPLIQRIAALEAQLEAERARHARELAAVRRSADRRMAALMREIAALRHHQARAEALKRMVGERDAALAAEANRVARLESLLRLQGAPR